MVQRLPPEPPSDVADVTTKIRFRLPGGNTATRRFLAAQSLQVPAVSFFFIWSKTNDVHRCLCWLEQVLLDYLLVEGYPAEEFKVLSSWPRKDVSLFSALLFSCSLKPN